MFDTAGNPLYHSGLRGVIDRVGLSTSIYLLAFVIWLVMTLLDQTYFKMYLPDIAHRVIRLICLFMLVAAEGLDWRARGISVRSLVGFFLSCLLVVVALIASVRMQIDAVLFVFCARNRDVELIFKVFLTTVLVVFITVILCSFVGVIDNTLVQKGRTRAYLGFRYALYPAACMMCITLLSLYFTKRHLFPWMVALLATANIAIFLYTDSRLSCGLSLFALVLAIVMHFWGTSVFRLKAVGIVFVCCFMLAALLSVVLTLAYSPDNQFFAELNQALGNRLKYGQRALTEYGVPLLGQDVEFVGAGLSRTGESSGGQYFYVDNIYVRLLVEYGAFAFAIFMVGYTLCAYKAWKAKNAMLVVALFILALHGLVDNLMLYLWFNPFLLLIGQLISDRGAPFALGVPIGRVDAL